MTSDPDLRQWDCLPPVEFLGSAALAPPAGRSDVSALQVKNMKIVTSFFWMSR